jgi:23S rRNA (cytidine2498-2'-O)-methyltransferase
LRAAGIKPKKMECQGDLILVDGFRRKPVWARNVWGSVERIEFGSVTDAIKLLRAMDLRWVVQPHLLHRRAALIAQGLSTPEAKPLRFPQDRMPERPLSHFMLLSEHELLASSHCAQTVPEGEMTFVDDGESRPSRAFLKLWEAFTRLGRMPCIGERCVDLGSCPGGWTGVIAALGAKVLSVDRTEIDASVLAMPGVEFVRGDAFGVDPSAHGAFDWVFSDLICEPGKLLELARRWLQAQPEASFLFSVKFKGETDHRVLGAFRAIPGSVLIHLNANKHEVTWVRFGPRALPRSGP